MMQKILAGTALTFLLIAGAPAAQAVPVGLELELLIDVSGSVDGTEFNLQKQGYVSAFQSAAVQGAITASTGGGIAVSLVQWSNASQQTQSVGWTLVNDAASANSLATAIDGIIRAFADNTAPGDAINFGVPLFDNNGFEGTRLVMDVSGDGAQNAGASTSAARDGAVAAGITINGLPILGEAGLLAFYQDNIAGGPGSFVTAANSFDDFGDAIRNKLVREITPVPEPATLAVMTLALVGLARTRRKQV